MTPVPFLSSDTSPRALFFEEDLEASSLSNVPFFFEMHGKETWFDIFFHLPPFTAKPTKCWGTLSERFFFSFEACSAELVLSEECLFVDPLHRFLIRSTASFFPMWHFENPFLMSLLDPRSLFFALSSSSRKGSTWFPQFFSIPSSTRFRFPLNFREGSSLSPTDLPPSAVARFFFSFPNFQFFFRSLDSFW